MTNQTPPPQTTIPSALSHSENGRGESLSEKLSFCIARISRIIILVSFALVCLFYTPKNLSLVLGATPEINITSLVEAIKSAEGSKNHPYGILKPYCKPNDPNGQCRKGCIQTINKWKKKLSYTSPEDFIRQFGAIYCPISDPRDISGLNKNWVRNVTKFYHSYTREKAR